MLNWVIFETPRPPTEYRRPQMVSAFMGFIDDQRATNFTQSSASLNQSSEKLERAHIYPVRRLGYIHCPTASVRVWSKFGTNRTNHAYFCSIKIVHIYNHERKWLVKYFPSYCFICICLLFRCDWFNLSQKRDTWQISKCTSIYLSYLPFIFCHVRFECVAHSDRDAIDRQTYWWVKLSLWART